MRYPENPKFQNPKSQKNPEKPEKPNLKISKQPPSNARARLVFCNLEFRDLRFFWDLEFWDLGFLPSRMRATIQITALLPLLILCACTTPPPPAPPPPQIEPTGDPHLDTYQQRLATAPPNDRALWEYHLALAALRRDRPDIATPALDDALALAAANYGNINAAAAKSRGLFQQEASKPFIGEAYERAMANYYRALLYWADAQPDNARALYRTAQLIDSDTLDKQYAGDYILPDYLDGYITARQTRDPASGADALRRARANAAAQNRPAPPDYDLTANVMIFVDYSTGPQKYAGGNVGQQLLYNIPPPTAGSARLTIDGKQHIALPPYDDIGFQAMTRGGRVMDQILGNKAQFKQNADTFGDATLTGAVIAANTSRSRDAQLTAAALASVGLISKAFSAATQTRADTRCWDTLPRYLSFAAIHLSPGTHNAILTFYTPDGRALPQQTQHFTITVPDPAALPLGAAPQDVVIYRSQLRN